MTLRLVLGRQPREAVEEIRRQATAVENLRTSGLAGPDLLNGYLTWAINAERMLRSHFTSPSVTSVLFTRRYWALQTPGPGNWAMTRMLAEAEIAQQNEMLLAEMAALNEATNRWTWGRLLVLDTSALIHGPSLWTWDPAAEFTLDAESIQIVLPMLVLDELDDLKEDSKQFTRTRARKTLKWLAEQLGSRNNIVIRPERGADPLDGSVARGEVHLDVLLDDANHVRLPIADDEIVDRAATVASTSGRVVTLVTNDVSQAYRARLAGLEVRAVAKPIYDVDVQEDARRAAKEHAKEEKIRDAVERRAAQEAGRGKRDTGSPQPPGP